MGNSSQKQIRQSKDNPYEKNAQGKGSKAQNEIKTSLSKSKYNDIYAFQEKFHLQNQSSEDEDPLHQMSLKDKRSLRLLKNIINEKLDSNKQRILRQLLSNKSFKQKQIQKKVKIKALHEEYVKRQKLDQRKHMQDLTNMVQLKAYRKQLILEQKKKGTNSIQN